MTSPDEKKRLKAIASAFKMPLFQTMVSRKSSVTNAAVNSIIPAIKPSIDDIAKALTILGMTPDAVRCAYCGDPATEWDHLRPLVINRRPTGFISELANLVPACGKCNQSKRNQPWREWMLNEAAERSPAGRGLTGIDERMARLEAFEKWRSPTHLDFESLIGRDEWERYWSLVEAVIEDMRSCKEVADSLKQRIAANLQSATTTLQT
jgi:hypothetical protein